MDGRNLRATCATTEGLWRDTVLYDPAGCTTDIENLNGELACSRDKATPPGDYHLSCKDVQVRNTTLTARCANFDARWVETSLKDFHRCISEIQNADGQLTCEFLPRGVNVPVDLVARQVKEAACRGRRETAPIWTVLGGASGAGFGSPSAGTR
jgi:hypothetical protein